MAWLYAPRLPAVYDLLRKAVFPLLEKGEVVLPASEVVREHHWNLFNDGVVARAFRAKKDPLDYHFSVDVELDQLEWIVFIDWAGEYFQELPLHAAQTVH